VAASITRRRVMLSSKSRLTLHCFVVTPCIVLYSNKRLEIAPYCHLQRRKSALRMQDSTFIQQVHAYLPN